jgi:2'-5' RNA ligase
MEQLSLFETLTPPPDRSPSKTPAASPPNRHRLLFAIFPDLEATDLIYEYQAGLNEKFRLTGRSRPRHILHSTVHHIGDYPEIPESVIATAIQAGDKALADRPSFEVTFDHAKSFRGRPGNLPFVLVNPNGNEALMALHHPLITELARHQLASRGDFRFVPHITLLYDKLNVPEQPAIPVGWTVREVVLILSHLGATKYDRLKSWTLNERK